MIFAVQPPWTSQESAFHVDVNRFLSNSQVLPVGAALGCWALETGVTEITKILIPLKSGSSYIQKYARMFM